MKTINLSISIIFSLLLIVNFCILTESNLADIVSTGTLDLKKLVNLANASVSEDPPWEKMSPELITSHDGSCFDCYHDGFGGVEQICPAISYWIYCFPDEYGDDNCQESQEVFCDTGSPECYPTGYPC
jgi:hypothetical protein